MRLLFTIISFSLFFFSRAQTDGVTYLEELHEFTLTDLDNYTRKLTVHGINTSGETQIIGFPVNELAKLKNYAIYEKKGKGWKLSKIQKNPRISTLDWSAFFTGTKKYYFEIPSGVEFRLEFQTAEKHSVFISKLYRDGWFDSKRVNYKFSLPEGVQLSSRESMTYSGSFAIDERDFDSLSYWSCIIHPSNEDAVSYFSNWFDQRISPQLKISESLIPLELKKIEKDGTRFELAKACFDFVKRDIKYLDIENGINAIIPHHCEKVLENGLGDCKDMTTLLTALYRYFEFEAYSGISRTNSMEGVFDFPSVGLANHSICALKLEDDWYYLDATEDVCLFGDPSTQILGTEVFLVGSKDGYFRDVPAVPRSESSATFNYLVNNEKVLQLEIIARGKMNQLFYYAKLKEKNPAKELEELLNAVSGFNWTVDSIQIIDSISTLKASAQLNASMYSKIGKRYMYDISFLPSPEILSMLFQNSEYPLYDSSIDFLIGFDGTITNDYESFPSITIHQLSSRVLFTCELEASEELQTFKDGELIKSWNEFTSQPLIVEYDQ